MELPPWARTVSRLFHRTAMSAHHTVLSVHPAIPSVPVYPTPPSVPIASSVCCHHCTATYISPHCTVIVHTGRRFLFSLLFSTTALSQCLDLIAAITQVWDWGAGRLLQGVGLWVSGSPQLTGSHTVHVPQQTEGETGVETKHWAISQAMYFNKSKYV